jgi:hypothetical protein
MRSMQHSSEWITDSSISRCTIYGERHALIWPRLESDARWRRGASATSCVALKEPTTAMTISRSVARTCIEIVGVPVRHLTLYEGYIDIIRYRGYISFTPYEG